jgi:hypothetical protein
MPNRVTGTNCGTMGLMNATPAVTEGATEGPAGIVNVVDRAPAVAMTPLHCWSTIPASQLSWTQCQARAEPAPAAGPGCGGSGFSCRLPTARGERVGQHHIFGQQQHRPPADAAVRGPNLSSCGQLQLATRAAHRAPALSGPSSAFRCCPIPTLSAEQSDGCGAAPRGCRYR